jgi:hypothetical protein
MDIIVIAKDNKKPQDLTVSGPWHEKTFSTTKTPSRVHVRHEKIFSAKTKAAPSCGFCFGGEGEIRTRAGVTPTNSLANCPLRPTWVLLHAEAIWFYRAHKAVLCGCLWRRERDLNP